jgi:drug/metabolite transporter (DMT)-like permease
VVAGSVPFLLPLYLTEGALPGGFTGWAMVVYLALFCTVLPYVLYAWGLKRTSATFSSLVLLFEVVMAAVLSSLFLGETFSRTEMLGGGLILLAIGLGGLGESQGRG